MTTTVGHLPKLVQRMKKVKGKRAKKSPQKKPSFSPAGALLSKMSTGAY